MVPFKAAVVIPQNDVEDGSVEQRLHLDLQGGEPDSTGCSVVYVLLQENVFPLRFSQHVNSQFDEYF